jgi:hypothetical protein
MQISVHILTYVEALATELCICETMFCVLRQNCFKVYFSTWFCKDVLCTIINREFLIMFIIFLTNGAKYNSILELIIPQFLSLYRWKFLKLTCSLSFSSIWIYIWAANWHRLIYNLQNNEYTSRSIDMVSELDLYVGFSNH